MPPDDEPRERPPRPENRGAAPSKRRRDGEHCPVCLAPLRKNAGRTRRVRECAECGAHPAAGKACARCGAENLWQGRSGVGCATCGHHGSPGEVVRGA